MELYETDRVIDVNTGKEFYIKSIVNDQVIADEVGSLDNKKDVVLKGEFKLASIIHGEYDQEIRKYNNDIILL